MSAPVYIKDSLGNQLPQSRVFPVETEFFVGQAILLIAGIHESLPLNEVEIPSEYFQ